MLAIDHLAPRLALALSRVMHEKYAPFLFKSAALLSGILTGEGDGCRVGESSHVPSRLAASDYPNFD